MSPAGSARRVAGRAAGVTAADRQEDEAGRLLAQGAVERRPRLGLPLGVRDRDEGARDGHAHHDRQARTRDADPPSLDLDVDRDGLVTHLRARFREDLVEIVQLVLELEQAAEVLRRLDGRVLVTALGVSDAAKASEQVLHDLRRDAVGLRASEHGSPPLVVVPKHLGGKKAHKYALFAQRCTTTVTP